MMMGLTKLVRIATTVALHVMEQRIIIVLHASQILIDKLTQLLALVNLDIMIPILQCQLFRIRFAKNVIILVKNAPNSHSIAQFVLKLHFTKEQAQMLMEIVLV